MWELVGVIGLRNAAFSSASVLSVVKSLVVIISPSSFYLMITFSYIYGFFSLDLFS
jgi:hypothetical protein